MPLACVVRGLNSRSPLRIAEHTVFEDDAVAMIHGPLQFFVRRYYVHELLPN